MLKRLQARPSWGPFLFDGLQRLEIFFQQLHEEPVAAAPAPAVALDAANEQLAACSHGRARDKRLIIRTLCPVRCLSKLSISLFLKPRRSLSAGAERSSSERITVTRMKLTAAKQDANRPKKKRSRAKTLER